MNNTNCYIKVTILLSIFILESFALEKRESFTVPLAILTVRFDDKTGNLDEVFISYGHKYEGYAISNQNDRYIKSTAKRQIDHIYKEDITTSYLLTDFEAKHLNKVCNTFIKTLFIFEKNLQKKVWGKLLYLDAYFPTFFHGFYYLVHASRNATDPLPPNTCIPNHWFDNSFRSPKSDKRIKNWRNNPEHVTKLRVIIKEVIYQIKQWQQLELTSPNRDLRLNSDKNFKEIYSLFITMYFNLKKQ